MKRIVWWVLFVSLGWAVVRTGERSEEALGRHRAQREALYLWSGRQVQRAFPGFEAVMADVYWLRAVQYYGWVRLYAEEKNYDLLEPLLDITVTLDPHLELAYWYGAIFLSEVKPEGAGKAEAGLALLERGCRENPLSWKLRQHLGYMRFLYGHDTDGAVQALLEGLKIPGAPLWLKTMAGRFLGQGGERDKARMIWTELTHDETGSMRANAELHLQILDALDQRDAVGDAVKRFQAARGRFPESLRELGLSGFFQGAIVDSTGVPFDYDPASGRVSIGRKSSLWRPDQ